MHDQVTTNAARTNLAPIPRIAQHGGPAYGLCIGELSRLGLLILQ